MNNHPQERRQGIVLWILIALIGLTLWIAASLNRDGQAAMPSLQPRAEAMKVVPANPLRFAAMGDWGAGSPMQFDVARQLATAWQKTPYPLVLLLGDNIYPDGNIKKFADAYFKRPYKPLLDQGVKFYAVLGNHDVLRSYAKDQIAFFKMPDRYYVRHEGNVDFFLLDTNRFYQEPAQRQWLEQALSKSRASWKVVAGHHPVYTSGEHGNEGAIRDLRKTLEPILIRHKVDLYLAGHDHDYERFKPTQGVTHIVSGGGGAYLRDFERILPNSLVRVKANHFLLFEATPEHLRFSAIDKAGQVIDSGEIPKNKALPVKNAA